VRVELRVNGRAHRLDVEARHTLADVLRDELGLTGTHLGCEHGVCGACTVLYDGDAVRSCLLFAVQAQGHEVATIECLADPATGELHPLQEAFRAHHGLQCGFCTPGMVLAALDLLRRNPLPTREEVREELSGNLCRCTGYVKIVDAVMEAARRPMSFPPWTLPPEASTGSV
jgi:carbon-monoxide dehydrogenase small subunit